MGLEREALAQREAAHLGVGDQFLRRTRKQHPTAINDAGAIDDVERGANDSDWQPAKDAAEKLALAEDRMALWREVSAADWLTADEKKALLGVA